MAVSYFTLRLLLLPLGFFILRIGGRHRQDRLHVAHASGFIAGQTIRGEKGRQHTTPGCDHMLCAEHWSVRVKAMMTHEFALLNVWKALEGCFRLFGIFKRPTECLCAITMSHDRAKGQPACGHLLRTGGST
jgi:hypothetical protein